MCELITEDKRCFVQVSKIFISCKEAEVEIRQAEQVRRLLRGSGKLIVPKTMVVGNQRDNFNRLAFLTSYGHEKYSAVAIALSLGYEENEAMWITHKGINTVDLVGRESGECSVILNDLDRFHKIIISQRLEKDLRRKNGVVAYALGNRVFWCDLSWEFIEYYPMLDDKIKVENVF